MRPEELQQPLQLYADYLKVEDMLADLPSEVGKSALEGAFDPVEESVNSTDGAFEYLQDLLNGHADTINLLLITRNNLLELGLSTADIDDKYDAEVVRRQEDLELRLAIAVVQSGETVVAGTTEVNSVPEPAPSPVITPDVELTQPASSETSEDNRPVFKVNAEINSEGKSYIQMVGSRKKKVALSTFKYNSIETGLGGSVEKLAATKVMFDIGDDEISVSELWRRIQLEMGIENPEVMDKQANNKLRYVRKFFEEDLVYGRQQLFEWNGEKGPKSGFKRNQDHRFRPESSITTEDIRAMQDILEKKRSGKVELSDIDPALVDLDDLQMFLGWIDIESVIADLHVSKFDSEKTEQLEKFLANNGDWIKMLNEVADDASSTNDNNLNKAEVVNRRLSASEKLFKLLGNPKKLEKALDKLIKVQEEDITLVPIVDILSEMKEFSKAERQLLQEIIERTTVQRIVTDNGSRSRGVSVTKIETIHTVGDKEYVVGDTGEIQVRDAK